MTEIKKQDTTVRVIPTVRVIRRLELKNLIDAELQHAYEKHGVLPWGRHEFYAILKEEVDELWEAIKKDRPTEEVEKELVQVAAMCFRYYETERAEDEPISMGTVGYDPGTSQG